MEDNLLKKNKIQYLKYNKYNNMDFMWTYSYIITTTNDLIAPILRIFFCFKSCNIGHQQNQSCDFKEETKTRNVRHILSEVVK